MQYSNYFLEDQFKKYFPGLLQEWREMIAGRGKISPRDGMGKRAIVRAGKAWHDGKHYREVVLSEVIQDFFRKLISVADL